MTSQLLEELQRRQLCHDSTDAAALGAMLDEGPQTLYLGFDPTADSLHVGSLLGVVTLRRFLEAGHKPIALVGGATGMIGDPSGRSDERNLLDEATLEANLGGIASQVRALLGEDVEVCDNKDWTEGVSVLEFLRDVGKHVTVNQMTAKDSVRSRLESEAGISYTEFSYMLLQAFDFWWLHEHKGCTLQLGGSDQWGNITAGIDLIRKRSGAAAHGLTWPLLTRSDGQKFGKTAEGTVWLSAERTIPFDFHQYFLRSDDRDVETLLAQLTLLPMADIEEVMKEHRKSPEQRAAQRALADEVTKFVHGENHVRKANDAAQVLYGNAVLTAELLESTRGIVGEVSVSRSDLEGETALETLLTQSGLCSSLSDARRQLSQSAVLINNERISPGAAEDPADKLTDKLMGNYMLLQRGKKERRLVIVQ